VSLGKTLKSYVWWTHERGSVHYDVMVTLILAFIFLTPHWINYGDQPKPNLGHRFAYPSGVSRLRSARGCSASAREKISAPRFLGSGSSGHRPQSEPRL